MRLPVLVCSSCVISHTTMCLLSDLAFIITVLVFTVVWCGVVWCGVVDMKSTIGCLVYMSSFN